MKLKLIFFFSIDSDKILLFFDGYGVAFHFILKWLLLEYKQREDGARERERKSNGNKIYNLFGNLQSEI